MGNEHPALGHRPAPRLTAPAFPGPVFRRELITAARGRCLYLFRALAAGALAAFVGSNIELRQSLSGARELTSGQIAALSAQLFRLFALSQMVLALAMTPLLVAGALADEKARGTLGLLLASRLHSAEIIAGKLAARVLLVLVLIAAAVPVLALIGLLGGIDPAELLLFTGMTLSSVWFAVCLSILISVHGRSVSRAIVGAYAAMFAWVVLPVWFLEWTRNDLRPDFAAAVLPIARGLARISPLSLFHQWEVWGPSVRTAAGRSRMAQELIALQAVGGLILVVLAAWRLRPVARAQADGVRSLTLGWLWRIAGLRGGARPTCGDDPIAWKEQHSAESAWLARLVMLGVLIVLTRWAFGEIQWMGGQEIAFDEMFLHGLDLGQWGQHGGYRNGLNYMLCSKAALLYFAGLVASAILAASSVAGERSSGTWESLLVTTLDRRSILRAKRRGAFRAIRMLMGLIVLLYLGSLASTAMHPAGFVLGLVSITAFLAFGVALGIYVSLRSKGLNQAIGRTVLILLTVNLAPAAALFPFVGWPALMATTPMLAIELPLSRMKYELVFHDQFNVLVILIPLGIVLAHSVAAWLLTVAADRRIEREL